MKLTLMTLGTVALVGMASAYDVTVTNQSNFGDPDLPIVDNAGNPLTSGSVGVGFFNADTDVTGNATDFAALLGTFQEYGTTTQIVQGAAPSLVNIVNPADWNVAVALGSTGGQIGQNVYVVFGNDAAGLAASTELAVWRSDSIFGTDDAAGNGGVAVDLVTGAGTLLLGTNTGPEDLGAIVFSDNITLVTSDIVPEPSTSLLGGLAGLALLARRRR